MGEDRKLVLRFWIEGCRHATMKTWFCGDIALEQDIDIVSSKFVEGLVVHRADVSVSLQFRYRSGIKSVDNERTDWSRHSWVFRTTSTSYILLFRRCLRMLIRCSCTLFFYQPFNKYIILFPSKFFIYIYSFFFFFLVIYSLRSFTLILLFPTIKISRATFESMMMLRKGLW